MNGEQFRSRLRLVVNFVVVVVVVCDDRLVPTTISVKSTLKKFMLPTQESGTKIACMSSYNSFYWLLIPRSRGSFPIESHPITDIRRVSLLRWSVRETRSENEEKQKEYTWRKLCRAEERLGFCFNYINSSNVLD